MNTFNKWFLGCLMVAGISSCLPPYPTQSELYQDKFVIVNRDTLSNFNKYITYAVPDTIFFLDDDSTLTPVEAEYSVQITDAFIQNMNARGYTRVARDENPDLAINVTAVISTTILVYPGYWWGYWDCYYWYYGCGWGYYPSYPIVSSYKSGSLVIEMADLKTAEEIGDGRIPLIWNSIIYTLTEDDPQFNVDKAVEGINTSFEISPYLTAN